MSAGPGGERAALDAAVAGALAGPFRRILSLDLPGGGRVWLKRLERRGLPARLQKGDPGRSFAAERTGLRILAGAGVPVPEILFEGEGLMVLSDAGPSLATLARDGSRDEGERLAGFAAAGRALALLHGAGFAHGRPAVRDICWDGKVARFIDLENFLPRRASPRRQARDLFLLCHSAERKWPDAPQWIGAALEGYAGAASPEAVRRAGRFARRHGWLGWLAAALRAVQPQSHTLRAVAPALARLRDWARAAAP